MKVEILTPEKKILKEDVVSLSLPTPNGRITVLDDHISLISSLSVGTLKVTTKKEELSFQVEGGLIEFYKNKANILLKKFYEEGAFSYCYR